MVTFTVSKIPEFNKTIQGVFKLNRDGKCLLDKFLDDIQDTNLEEELGTLYQIVEDIADCKPHPKCRKLKLEKKIKFSGYEAKSKHLRLYFFHDKGTGQIIAIGGTKKNQRFDIDRFEKILKEYSTYKQAHLQ